MNNAELVALTADFVKETLAGAEGGHDWFHIERVHRNAVLIGQGEKVDMLIVELGALLHDIADAKFHNGDENIGPKMAGEFLSGQGVTDEIIDHIQNIIRNISFKSSLEAGSKNRFVSNELKVVQDADRLDAMAPLESQGHSITAALGTGHCTILRSLPTSIWTRKHTKTARPLPSIIFTKNCCYLRIKCIRGQRKK